MINNLLLYFIIKLSIYNIFIYKKSEIQFKINFWNLFSYNYRSITRIDRVIWSFTLQQSFFNSRITDLFFLFFLFTSTSYRRRADNVHSVSCSSARSCRAAALCKRFSLELHYISQFCNVGYYSRQKCIGKKLQNILPSILLLYINTLL